MSAARLNTAPSNSAVSPPTINADLQATFTPPPGVAYNWKSLGAANDNRDGFGGFAGYNSQWDDVVVGIEANYMHGGFRALTSSTGYTYNPDFTIASTTHSSALVRLSDFGSVRVRAGYAIDSYLPYVFAGVGLRLSDRRPQYFGNSRARVLTGPARQQLQEHAWSMATRRASASTWRS